GWRWWRESTPRVCVHAYTGTSYAKTEDRFSIAGIPNSVQLLLPTTLDDRLLYTRKQTVGILLAVSLTETQAEKVIRRKKLLPVTHVFGSKLIHFMGSDIRMCSKTLRPREYSASAAELLTGSPD
ncbi:MAG: hypothetical protein K8U57_34715, partial [Planctomycetes bacterium]|nr:hypothetical protein [Planctomycetota bacterium]